MIFHFYLENQQLFFIMDFLYYFLVKHLNQGLVSSKSEVSKCNKTQLNIFPA